MPCLMVAELGFAMNWHIPIKWLLGTGRRRQIAHRLPTFQLLTKASRSVLISCECVVHIP